MGAPPGSTGEPTASQERRTPTDAITIINESRDKVRVALFKQPASPEEPAIALHTADVAVNSRTRMAAPPGEVPADLRLAIVRSTQPGSALPSWAVHEAVSVQHGQTAKVRGSLTRGYEIRVK